MEPRNGINAIMRLIEFLNTYSFAEPSATVVREFTGGQANAKFYGKLCELFKAFAKIQKGVFYETS